MKTIWLSILFSALLSFNAYGQRVQQSGHSLLTVLDAIYDASFDFEGVYTITHNAQFLGEKKDCQVVEASSLISHFVAIFDEFISYYPDEELPFDEALIELEGLAAGSAFERCYEKDETNDSLIEVTHYRALEHRLWFRIEYSVHIF